MTPRRAAPPWGSPGDLVPRVRLVSSGTRSVPLSRGRRHRTVIRSTFGRHEPGGACSPPDDPRSAGSRKLAWRHDMRRLASLGAALGLLLSIAAGTVQAGGPP